MRGICKTGLAPLLLLLGGCYPYIRGSWDDYWLPDTVRVVGAATHTEPLGGYWSNPAPYGTTWWGWLDEGHDISALDMLTVEGPGCSRGEPDEAVVTSLLGDPGASTSVVRGPRDIELAWSSSRMRFEADTDELPAGSYSLDPVIADEAGIIEVEPLFGMPPAVAFDGPPLGGIAVATGTLDDLVFSWDASSMAADWVHVEVRLSGLGSSGYSAYEWATCLVPFSEGSVTFAPALWTDTGRGDAVYVLLSTVDERLERVGDRSFSSSAVGVRRQIGILRLE